MLLIGNWVGCKVVLWRVSKNAQEKKLKKSLPDILHEPVTNIINE